MKTLHLWWTIGVLTAIILFLLAYIFINLVLSSHIISQYLSVVATVLSIVLSIFAIIYSYVSTVEASRQWADIDGAVKEIKITNTHIHSSNQMLLTLINNIYGTVSAIGARQLNQAPPDQSMNSVQNVQDIPGNRLDNQNDNEPVDE